MDNSFKHHGILGQKWGVRRTPAQLGHAPSGSKDQGSGSKSSGKESNSEARKSAGKSAKRPRAMSDDELRERINRLNMEEQYENLVARQKQRSTGTVKKLLSEAAESFGRKALGLAVDKFLNKIKSDESKSDKSDGDEDFNINDWKNKSVHDMDPETISKVAKWYESASKITLNRSKVPAPPPDPVPSPDINKVVRQRRAAMKQLGTPRW